MKKILTILFLFAAFISKAQNVHLKSGQQAQTVYNPVYYLTGTGTSTDTVNAINAAITAANTAGGGIVHLPKGVWSVKTSFLWSAGSSVVGIQMKSNVILEGEGIGITTIRDANPNPSSTFNTSSFATNTHWTNIINCVKISNFQIRNLSINGARSFQINYNPNVYSTPQPNLGDTVQTNAIFIDSCSAIADVVNVRVDSSLVCGVYNHTTPNSKVDRCIFVSCLLRGMMWQGTLAAIGLNCNGSVLSNSKIIYSGADNVGITATGGISIINNDISWSQKKIDTIHGNSAGIYIAQYLFDPNFSPIFIEGNSIHDNSAVGIDMDYQDTVYFNFNGQSIMVRNNKIYRNAGLGATCRYPNVSFYGNGFYNNGTDSLGFHDNVGGGYAAINLKVPNAQGVDITGNTFVDTTGNKWVLMIGAGSTTHFMKFTNNIIRGFSSVLKGSILSATAPFNTVFGNTWEDNGTLVHSDMSTDGSGNFYLQPQLMNATNQTGSGSIILNDGSAPSTLYGYHTQSNSGGLFIEDVGWVGGDMYHSGTGTALMGIQLGSSINTNYNYAEGSEGTNSGRSIGFLDISGSTTGRMGIGPSGNIYIGKSYLTQGTTWSTRFTQPASTSSAITVAKTIGSAPANGVDMQFTGTGSSSVPVGLNVLVSAGFTGATSYATTMGNVSVTTGNNSGGAATTSGTKGGLFYASGASAANNIGFFSYGSDGTKNIGAVGDATFHQLNSASGISIGLLGYALRANSSAIEIAGYFGLQTTQPTYENAALLADNGAEAVPIQLWRDNGTKVMAVVDGGNLVLNNGITNNSTGQLQVTNTTHQVAGHYDATHYYQLDAGSSGGTTLTLSHPVGFHIHANSGVGSLSFDDVGGGIFFNHGTGGRSGTATLSSGTVAITVTNATTSSVGLVSINTPSGSSLTVKYQVQCTTGSCTIQANIAGDTINTSDNSLINYVIFD